MLWTERAVIALRSIPAFAGFVPSVSVTFFGEHFMLRIHCILGVLFFSLVAVLTASADDAPKVFKAGAAVVDITPTKLPIIPRGNFFPKPIDNILDPLHARCLMLHDGKEQIVLLLIDCCTLPRTVVEKMKAMIVEKTGIPRERITITATHTHSAPAVVEKHADGETRHTLENIVQAAVLAQKNLVPAKIGWAVGNNPYNVFCRRILMKEGTATRNPFGGTVNDRAQMNPGYGNTNMVARTGPVDTAVSVISIVTPEGKPLALFANYSTHYAGVPADQISADYFGVFAGEIRDRIAEKVGEEKMSENFVGMMSNGTSGDANCLDFLNPNQPKYDIYSVAKNTADAAMAVWPNIEYFDWVPLGMAEQTLTLNNRLPTAVEIQAAKDHLAALPDGPKVIIDDYAASTVAMENHPKTSEVVVQAMRIGELGMTALPGEIYGITGLEIKARSPFLPTINLSLANGTFGYIPPEEQHRLGGYNTWRRPGNCLEPAAEGKIRATVIDLLKSLDSKQ